MPEAGGPLELEKPMSVKALLATAGAVLIPAALLAAIAVAGFWRGGDGHATFALADVPPETAHAYQFAEVHPEEMRSVPCYCGCAGLGHQNLLDCFVRPTGGYEPHASGCAICTREATDVERMLGEGASVATIRATIDTDYAKYGHPTDTP